MPKTLNADLTQEIDLLNLFDLGTTQQGIKIHHEADKQRIAAAQRLFDKGMITLPDGGYLTDRGVETAEHAQALIRLLHV
jgi:uncharacterized protein (TIGR02647 family)